MVTGLLFRIRLLLLSIALLSEFQSSQGDLKSNELDSTLYISRVWRA